MKPVLHILLLSLAISGCANSAPAPNTLSGPPSNVRNDPADTLPRDPPPPTPPPGPPPPAPPFRPQATSPESAPVSSSNVPPPQGPSNLSAEARKIHITLREGGGFAGRSIGTQMFGDGTVWWEQCSQATKIPRQKVLDLVGAAQKSGFFTKPPANGGVPSACADDYGYSIRVEAEGKVGDGQFSGCRSGPEMETTRTLWRRADMALGSSPCAAAAATVRMRQVAPTNTSSLQELFGQLRNRARMCCAAGFQDDPAQTGEVVLTLHYKADGTPDAVTVGSHAGLGARTAECIVVAARAARVPGVSATGTATFGFECLRR